MVLGMEARILGKYAATDLQLQPCLSKVSVVRVAQAGTDHLFLLLVSLEHWDYWRVLPGLA